MHTTHIRRLRWVAFVVGTFLASQLHAFAIYEEGFVSPWVDGSVNATIVAHDPRNPVNLSFSAYCGTKTAIVNHAGGGVFRLVRATGQNIGGNNALIFAVRNYNLNNVDSSTGLAVQLYDSTLKGLGWVSILPYVPGKQLKANTWYSIEIPLTALNATTSIRGVGFLSSGQLVYAWDCVRIEWRAAFVPPVVNASSSIFTDVLRTGWTIFPWDTTYNGDSSVHYSGSEGLQITFNRAWAGFQFWPTAFNTTGYNALTFAIHGGQWGGQEMWVSLYDSSSNRLNHLNLANYVVGKVLTPFTWHLVRIPLADLGGLNRTITAVEFESATAATITLDDVRFDSLTEPSTGACNDNP